MRKWPTTFCRWPDETTYYEEGQRWRSEAARRARVVELSDRWAHDVVVQAGRDAAPSVHRHTLWLVTRDSEAREAERWVIEAARASPRAHVVVDLRAAPRLRGRGRVPGALGESIARRMAAGRLDAAAAMVAASRVSARLRGGRVPLACTTWGVIILILRGRLEEARAVVAETRPVAVAGLQALISAACRDYEQVVSTIRRQIGRNARPDRWLRPPGVETRRRAGRAASGVISGAPRGHTALVRREGMAAVTGTFDPKYLLHVLPALLRLVTEGDDEQSVLQASCRWCREQAGAESVAVVALPDWRLLAHQAWCEDAMTISERRLVADASQEVRLVRPDGVVFAAPVRYGGVRIGAVVGCGALARSETLAEAVRALAAVMPPAVQGRLLEVDATRRSEGLASDIVGRSAAMAAVRDAIVRAASTPFSVLIEGESGTGKELVARAIHRLSARRTRRFAPLNCAALTDDLAEAELFGHTRGAFTGAVAARLGVFEDAQGGTVFLDEVAELSPRVQAKLLRVMQEREVRRLGENGARPVDVRVLAATNRGLTDLATRGAFRDDLLFRIAVVRLRLPPLRDRTEDIPVLAQRFWRPLLADAGKRAVLGADALARLVCHAWPGNVRELQNVMAGLVMLAPVRGRVSARQVEHVLAESAAAILPAAMSLDVARARCERVTVAAALARHGGRRVAAARELGLTRQGLAKAVRRLRLVAPGDVEGVA